MNAPFPSFLTLDTQFGGTQSFQFENDMVGIPRDVSFHPSTSAVELPINVEGVDRPIDMYVARTQLPQRRFELPSVMAKRRMAANPDSSVIQIWEGKVLRIDPAQAVMEATLEAKIGNITPHVAEIELQWVADQDMDLVQPGAIFYLTLFKRTRNGTIENTQELRFRRLPAWTRKQVAQVHQDAARMLTKMKAKPLAA